MHDAATGDNTITTKRTRPVSVGTVKKSIDAADPR